VWRVCFVEAGQQEEKINLIHCRSRSSGQAHNREQQPGSPGQAPGRSMAMRRRTGATPSKTKPLVLWLQTPEQASGLFRPTVKNPNRMR